MTQQQPIAYGCYRHPDRGTYIRCQRCGRPICGDCMVSAAVGFHCPECVAAGARDTRQNQGPYGGQRSRDPRITTFVLMGVNVAVWVLILLNSQLASLLALQPVGSCLSALDPSQWYPNATTAAQCAAASGGSWQPGVSSGAWWQLLTSAFTHEDAIHIGVNMLSLWFLGPPIEAALGRARFLTVYLLSALAGSTAVMWLSNPQSLTLGASGAVFGLLGALLVVVYKVRGDVRNVLMWLGLNVAFTFLGNGISWQGHIGGLVGGALLTALIVYAPRQGRPRVQWLGAAGFAVLLAVLVAVRVLQLS